VSTDSYFDTKVHINKVRANLAKVAGILTERGFVHDESKLVDPEKPIFDEIRPLLDTCEYGGDDYKALMVRLKPALEHHFAHNRHHPEFFGEDSVNGMNLLDLVEMVCDWQAAAMRKPDGDVRKGLPYNFDRYNIDPQLARIIENTVEALWES
jgi:hypothetical protein